MILDFFSNVPIVVTSFPDAINIVVMNLVLIVGVVLFCILFGLIYGLIIKYWGGKKMNYLKLLTYIMVIFWMIITFMLVANASSGYFIMLENPELNLKYFILSVLTITVIIFYAGNDLWDDKK